MVSAIGIFQIPVIDPVILPFFLFLLLLFSIILYYGTSVVYSSGSRVVDIPIVVLCLGLLALFIGWPSFFTGTLAILLLALGSFGHWYFLSKDTDFENGTVNSQ